MRKLCLCLSILAFGFESCNSDGTKIVTFIPGVYVKQISDEFTSGVDTIIISEMDKQNGSYTITRKTAYHQTIDGKELPPKEETHVMIAVYLAETKQLKEEKQGRLFTFFPAKQALSMGSTLYAKISNQQP